jgi:transcriptional regulator with PAS, ATPase and Fis domain
MPGLKQREEDIIPMAYYLIRKFSNRTDIKLSSEAALKLKNYDWPGNIRELENVIRHALILMNEENIIGSRHLPLELNQGYWSFRDKNIGLREMLQALERSIIEQALLENDLNVEKCALALKVSKRTLYYRMNKLNVDLADNLE